MKKALVMWVHKDGKFSDEDYIDIIAYKKVNGEEVIIDRIDDVVLDYDDIEKAIAKLESRVGKLEDPDDMEFVDLHEYIFMDVAFGYGGI